MMHSLSNLLVEIGNSITIARHPCTLVYSYSVHEYKKASEGDLEPWPVNYMYVDMSYKAEVGPQRIEYN